MYVSIRWQADEQQMDSVWITELVGQRNEKIHSVINTLVYRQHVLDEEVADITWRACHLEPETLMRILSACKYYASCCYIHRNNADLRALKAHT